MLVFFSAEAREEPLDIE